MKTSNINLLNLVLYTIFLISFFSCQNEDAKKIELCGKKYKIWKRNEKIDKESCFDIFYSDGSCQTVFLMRLGKFYSYSMQNDLTNSWALINDSFFVGKRTRYIAIKNDTLRYGNDGFNYSVDYTSLIDLNGNKLQSKSFLNPQGIDKLYEEMVHVYHDTLSRKFFNSFFEINIKMPTQKEKQEYEEFMKKMPKKKKESHTIDL
jgi:hypothetical protein